MSKLTNRQKQDIQPFSRIAYYTLKYNKVKGEKNIEKRERRKIQ